MAEPAVLYEVRDGIGVITLNRPDNRNSMTDELLGAFAEIAATVRDDDALRALVITGRGRCFCAGADLKAGAQRDPGARALLPNERSFAMYQPFLTLLEVDVPIIGALNGHAIGGGLGLALVCDLRVGNRNSRYGANFTRLGLHPGMSITYLLPRVVGVPRAAELLFTGRIVSGAEMEAFGLFNYAEDDAEAVWGRAWSLAEECAASAPIATRWTKRSLYRNLGWDPVPAAEVEAGLQSRTLDTEDHREGSEALLQKRAPRFQGR